MEDSTGQTSLAVPQNKCGQVVARLQEGSYVLTKLLKIELYLTTEVKLLLILEMQNLMPTQCYSYMFKIAKGPEVQNSGSNCNSDSVPLHVPGFSVFPSCLSVQMVSRTYAYFKTSPSSQQKPEVK